MKTPLSIFALLALGFAACNSGTTTTTATDTTAAMTPDGTANTVTTSTTTTTTRPLYQPKPEVKYIDLRTHQQILVRVDTIHHYIVNTVTNQPVDFILEPGTTDTIYGRDMTVVNGYINYTPDNWTVNESTSGNNSTQSATTTDSQVLSPGKEVRKVKIKEDKTKIKYEDGSKVKTNEHETKIKNK